MAKIAEVIQKRLELSDRKMSIAMKMTDNTTWRKFKESKSDYLTRLYRLYEISGLTASQFLELFKK